MAIPLPSNFAEAATKPRPVPLVRLPSPFNTTYEVVRAQKKWESLPVFQVMLAASQLKGKALPIQLQSSNLFLTDFIHGNDTNEFQDNNTPWARARRAPLIVIFWDTEPVPFPDHIWLIAYFIFTIRADLETVRLQIRGSHASRLVHELNSLLLTVPHPAPDHTRFTSSQTGYRGEDEVLLLRAAFWQGAASPTGSRAIWLPPIILSSGKSQADYPVPPQLPTMTTKLPKTDGTVPPHQQRIIHASHSSRREKPSPGSVVYSRYFPTIGEEFSMVVLDVTNPEHLNLVHNWQNDPRVSAGWNETGSIEHHRRYLEEIESDPHQFAVLARFDSTFFAYYEFYYAREDHLGPHWTFDDYDRGRHNLVGDASFRGPHRVNSWWSSQIHFLFLDDPRTMNVVGEPRATAFKPIAYDLVTGFSIEKSVDLLHKRSALARLSRDRFFQLDPSGTSITDRNVAGTRIGLSTTNL